MYNILLSFFLEKIAFEDSADSRELHSACFLPYSLKYSDTFGNLRAILYSGYSIGADESCSPLFRENLTVVEQLLHMSRWVRLLTRSIHMHVR